LGNILVSGTLPFRTSSILRRSGVAFCTASPSTIVNAPNESLAPAQSAKIPRTSGVAFYLLVVVVLGGAAGLFVAGMLPKLKRQAGVAEQTRNLLVVRVRTGEATPAPIGVALALPAELKPATEASLLARVTGYVRKWHVDLGDQVKAGQLLAELDTPELERELGRAEAQLTLAEAAHKLAESTAKRWQELFAAKTASSQETDEKQADLEFKGAAVNTARAEVQRLQQIAAFALISAPFAGTVTARHVDLGQLVEAGGNKELFHLADTSRLRVFIHVPQAYARGIKTGQPAELLLAELRGTPIPVRVVRTAGAIDAASRTLLVELEADNADGGLLAGGYAQVRLPGVDTDRPLAVSANALIFRAEGPMVVSVDAGGMARLHKVVLGRDFGSAVEVLEGLPPGGRVILNPPDSITEGVRVEVVE
jgi:RND family efflux transporter MFP subunit